jgi:hypothetical protein
LIEGNYAADVTTGTITNYGRIIGAGTGAFVANGSVVNGSKYDRSALIQGGFSALEIEEDGASVTNFGAIVATGERGVFLWGSTTLTNGTAGDITASISGATAITDGGALTATNYGAITGWGGDGISLSAGGNITNGGSTDKTASISGYAGVVSSGTATTFLTNFGSIVATLDAGVSLGGGGQVMNGTGGDAHALISGAGGVILGAAGLVRNYATIDGNSGAGVGLNAGGGVTNGGGVDTSALIEGYSGVSATGVAASVTNFGTILGTGGLGHYGVYISVAGGTLTNGSVNNSTALVAGYGGVDLGMGARGVNFGTLRGAGNIGGVGALLVSGAALVNGAVGKPGAVIDGYKGVVSYGGAATFTNFGTVIGENGTAVSLTSKTDVLAIEPGCVFVGSLTGGGAVLELGSGTWTHAGLLSSTGGITLSGPITATTFSAFGGLEVGPGASLAMSGNGAVGATQRLILAGTLTTAASLTTTGSLNLSGTLAGTGTLAITGGSATFANGADIAIAKITQSGGTANFTGASTTIAHPWSQTAGTVTVATGDKATFTGAGNVFDGTLAGAGTVQFAAGSDAWTGTHITATSVIVTGTTVTLSGAIALSHTVVVTSPSLAVAAAGASLTGAGILELTNNATNALKGGPLTNAAKIEGSGLISVASLTNSGTIDANFATALTLTAASGTVVNSGLIENVSTGGLTITSAVTNTGSLSVTKGTLTVDGAVSGAGTVRISGGTADMAGAFAGAVTFTSAGGTLALAHARTDTVTITGFAKTPITRLDLQDIAFTGATVKYSGTTASGTLTVTDGTHTTHITLMGNYLASTFNLANDGSGHVLVTDPTPTKPPVTAQPLAAAMAGFGDGRTAETSPGPAGGGERSPPLLTVRAL